MDETVKSRQLGIRDQLSQTATIRRSAELKGDAGVLSMVILDKWPNFEKKTFGREIPDEGKAKIPPTTGQFAIPFIRKVGLILKIVTIDTDTGKATTSLRAASERPAP